MKTYILASLAIIITFSAQANYEQHSLKWPTQISETPHKFGPNFHQFQKFQDAPYFHEGLDILTPVGQEITTPVSGLVDAGYYSYTTLENGLGEKQYLSIRDIADSDKEPKLWGDQYFEVSITDEFQNRFEFHHIDRYSMPESLVHAIKNNKKINAQTFLGTVVKWPMQVRSNDYHHIHYSILNSEGVQQNPMWFSPRLADTSAPTVDAKYVRLKQRCSFNGGDQYKELSQLKDTDQVTHIVLKTEDFIGENSFPNPPTRLMATFNDGSQYHFDYSKSLFDNTSNSLTLRDLYAGRFCLGSSEFPFVIKGSETFKFYIKVPVPENYKGIVEISVSDFNGNTNNFNVDL